MDDEINCCSAYFYTRYTDENTLIDLSMVKHSYYEKNDDCLLSEDDRPFIRRLLTFTEYRPSWFHIIFLVFFFIICSCLIIYLYHYLFNQPKLMYSSLDKTSTKS